MKSNGFSRRGLLMGAATLAVSRLKAADDTTLPTMELQQMAEGVSGASVAPPFAYVGCYTGGSNARGISVFHYDQVTNETSDHLSGFTHDLKDNVVTARVQMKF